MKFSNLLSRNSGQTDLKGTKKGSTGGQGLPGIACGQLAQPGSPQLGDRSPNFGAHRLRGSGFRPTKP